MSKQIHDEGRRESSRKEQVRFRAEATLLDAFDEWVDESEYGSRSEALRAAMRQTAGAGHPDQTPLVPPADEPLRTAYIKLCDVANADGVIRHDIAEQELSTILGKRKRTVNHMILGKLRDRGYLNHVANVYGDRSWGLTGWDA
ncbi:MULTISPECIES: ribbon-helix-helix domain-containing protein [Salinibaculum]|uniref:ribbon-helix-helix domain-containing protein n=1 Tax=Salinibaculum TaxID=2732368 RepID=UPI0030CC803E